MINTIQRFWQDESGPELVEWAVVTIILLVAAVVLYVAVGKALGGVLCSIYCWIASVRDSTKQSEIGRDACDGKGYDECEQGEGDPI
jgi:Flp pilus assembly pilin Flp